jgi:hypothetical protein
MKPLPFEERLPNSFNNNKITDPVDLDRRVVQISSRRPKSEIARVAIEGPGEVQSHPLRKGNPNRAHNLDS